jgi:hypothetical protein
MFSKLQKLYIRIPKKNGEEIIKKLLTILKTVKLWMHF